MTAFPIDSFSMKLLEGGDRSGQEVRGRAGSDRSGQEVRGRAGSDGSGQEVMG